MKPFLDLGERECRWSVAHFGGVQQFCAEPVDAARVYCPAHHALAVPHGTPAQPAFRHRQAGEPPCARTVRVAARPHGADLADVLGCKRPAQPMVALAGARGKRVDEEGFETADREPDLCELFEGAR